MTLIQQRKHKDSPKSLKLDQIAKLVGGEIVGQKDLEITGVAGIKEAKKGDITFLANAKYLPFLDQTQASAVLTAQEIKAPSHLTIIRTANPSVSFNKIVSFFAELSDKKPTGIHERALVHESAVLGKEVTIGPNAVIEENVQIKDRSVIEAGVYIGKDSEIGLDCHIYPNVTLREKTIIGNSVIIHSGTVLGSDGFGYDTVNGKHLKIPHVGNVQVEDDVEIGANVCIDRGRFKTTLIKKGSKIDNLVQIAHNVVIGEDNLIVSQAGISGSSETGKNVVIAGQAGIVGHITIGDESIIGAKSGVTKSLEPKSVVLGSPAKPILEQKKLFVLISRLPELFKDIQELKKKFLQ